jgi:1,4-dihydroxy-2-naphthoate octaprenyltransferase
MKAWLRATRAVSLTAVLAPSIAVLLAGRLQHASIDVWRTLAALLGVSALLLGVNMQNDVEDDARGIDGNGSLGGSGVIQSGALAAPTMNRAAYGLMLFGLVLGVPTLLVAPREMLALGVVTAIGASGYSGKPFGLKYRALGDLTVFMLCGPLLTFGASVAMFGRAIPGAWLLGALFGAAATAILHVNNLQDSDVDRKAGAHTVALVLGETGSRIYLALLYISAALAWGTLSLPFTTLAIGALGFVPALRLLSRVIPTRNLSVYPLLRVEAAQAHLAIGAAIAAGLIIGGLSS